MIEDCRRGNSLALQTASWFLNLPESPIEGTEVRSLSKDFGIDENYAYALLLFSLAGFDGEKNAFARSFFENWIRPMVSKLSPQLCREDAYYKNIPFIEGRRGEWRWGKKRIAPYEAFVSGDLARFPDGRIVPKLGFFTEEVLCNAVYQGEREWMSVVPNEIATMKKPVAQAQGDVLTYGLGLGYYAYMASQKEQVRSVTVVERDRAAIAFFTENILPFFSHGDKITVREADAFAYAASLRPGAYDYIFTDLWHDAGDGLPLYQKMKALEKTAPNTRYGYWIEDSLEAYLQEDLWQ